MRKRRGVSDKRRRAIRKDKGEVSTFDSDATEMTDVPEDALRREGFSGGGDRSGGRKQGQKRDEAECRLRRSFRRWATPRPLQPTTRISLAVTPSDGPPSATTMATRLQPS